MTFLIQSIGRVRNKFFIGITIRPAQPEVAMRYGEIHSALRKQIGQHHAVDAPTTGQ